jgi:oligoribonuclease
VSNLANMFAVLNLDAEDDREEVKKPAPSKTEAAVVALNPGKSALSTFPQLVYHRISDY